MSQWKSISYPLLDPSVLPPQFQNNKNRMNKKRLQPTDSTSVIPASKRYENYDSAKIRDILTLLEDELAILDKVMYTQRNQHRNCIYYRSMKTVGFLEEFEFQTIRYCRKVWTYAKDLTSHLDEYEDLVMYQYIVSMTSRVDGLLQTCCIILKVSNQEEM